MTVTIKLDGKIFDPALSGDLRKAIHDGIEELVLDGEADVKRQLYPGHGHITGNLRNAVAGTVRGDYNGQIDAGEVERGSNVVYAAWVEGTSTRNSSRGFRGYRMFQNTADKLNSSDLDKYFVDRLRNALGD